jgi:arsenate reductase (thioredoxin)
VTPEQRRRLVRGTEPGGEINPAAVAAMAEVGIDITGEFPKPWTDEIVRAADVVITTGCGDACPLYPGKRYEDWALDDPAELDVVAVRPIRDEIRRRVEHLLDEFTSALTPGRRWRKPCGPSASIDRSHRQPRAAARGSLPRNRRRPWIHGESRSAPLTTR